LCTREQYLCCGLIIVRIVKEFVYNKIIYKLIYKKELLEYLDLVSMLICST